mgnify:CR=1 FL=1
MRPIDRGAPTRHRTARGTHQDLSCAWIHEDSIRADSPLATPQTEPHRGAAPGLRRVAGARLAGALLICGLAGVLLGGVSCESGPTEKEVFDAALVDHTVPGEIVPGARLIVGPSRNQAALDRQDPIAEPLLDRAALEAFWSAAGPEEEPPPDVNFGSQTVVALRFVRRAASEVSLYEVRRSDDGFLHVYLLGDTAPVAQVRYPYPTGVLILPFANRPTQIELIYYAQRATGGLRIDPRGTILQLPLQQSP